MDTHATYGIRTFERESMLQRIGKGVLKGATIKRKSIPQC